MEFYEGFLIDESRQRREIHSVGSDHAEAFERKPQATEDSLILKPARLCEIRRVRYAHQLPRINGPDLST